jgi:hypothetical protein
MNTFVQKPKEGSREIAGAPSCAESGCPAPPQFTETERGAAVQQRAEFTSNQANLQLKKALDRSPRVAVQRKLAAVMANAPVQRRGIPLNDDAALEREADEMGKQAMNAPGVQRKASPGTAALNSPGVLQRYVTKSGFFDAANAPDETSIDYVSFDDTQNAYDLYDQAASELPGWSALKADPDTNIHFTTNFDLDAQGSTSLWVTDADGEEHSTQVGGASIQEWSRWIGPHTPVTILIEINPAQVDFKMEAVAHTINHEVSLHAIPTLVHIKQLRRIDDDDRRTQQALENVEGQGSESAQHERFVLGKNQNLLFTHKKMMEAAKATGWDAVRNLAGDYRADWTARREGSIAEHKQKVLDLSDNPDESKLTEPILLLWLGNYRKRRLANPASITAEERTKARAIQELYDLLAYDYQAHRDDVLNEYGFDLYPSVDE